MNKIFCFFILLLSVNSFSCFGQSKDYLVLVVDTIRSDTTFGDYGYRNLRGDTIIPLGKYGMCFTDTFKNYAIVLKSHKGFVAIDRKENVLYEVFPYDNGPDYPSEGLFRILKKGKIGYADSKTGKVVIKPQYDCAWPFEKEVFKVSIDCKEEQVDEEHMTWLSDEWYYINKKGIKVSPPKDSDTK